MSNKELVAELIQDERFLAEMAGRITASLVSAKHIPAFEKEALNRMRNQVDGFVEKAFESFKVKLFEKFNAYLEHKDLDTTFEGKVARIFKNNSLEQILADRIVSKLMNENGLALTINLSSAAQKYKENLHDDSIRPVLHWGMSE